MKILNFILTNLCDLSLAYCSVIAGVLGVALICFMVLQMIGV